MFGSLEEIAALADVSDLVTKAYLKNSAVYEQGLLLTLGGHFSRSNRR